MQHFVTVLIASILKSSKPSNDPTSYCPISLLKSLSKLTEAFIARQLNDHIQTNNIISPIQFGFRAGRSVPHQIYMLVEHITTGKISKKIPAAVFLDIKKAYEKVWILF